MSGAGRRGRWSAGRRVVAWSFVGVLGASLALACASIIGIDDRLPDELDGDGDGGVDQAANDDGPAAPRVCPPTAKCVSVPEGWKLASLAPAQRPGCADGYDTPRDVVVAADGLGCTCKCTETAPGSCAAAGATTTFRDYPVIGCSASTSTYLLDVLDGGCHDATITTTPAVRIPTPASAPPSCAADAGPSPLGAGQTCLARPMTCDDGGMCAGALPGGEHVCVVKDGDLACPPGFARRFPVGTSAAMDTRQCGTCTCTPGSTCNAPVLELFTGGGCTKGTIVVPATGSCTGVDAGVAYASYRYSGKAPGCQPSVPPLLDGGVTIEGLETVCCQPSN